MNSKIAGTFCRVKFANTDTTKVYNGLILGVKLERKGVEHHAAVVSILDLVDDAKRWLPPFNDAATLP